MNFDAKSKGGKILLRAFWNRKHLIALERGDEKRAKEYLDNMNNIK